VLERIGIRRFAYDWRRSICRRLRELEELGTSIILSYGGLVSPDAPPASQYANRRIPIRSSICARCGRRPLLRIKRHNAPRHQIPPRINPRPTRLLILPTADSAHCSPKSAPSKPQPTSHEPQLSREIAHRQSKLLSQAGLRTSPQRHLLTELSLRHGDVAATPTSLVHAPMCTMPHHDIRSGSQIPPRSDHRDRRALRARTTFASSAPSRAATLPKPQTSICLSDSIRGRSLLDQGGLLMDLQDFAGNQKSTLSPKARSMAASAIWSYARRCPCEIRPALPPEYPRRGSQVVQPISARRSCRIPTPTQCFSPTSSATLQDSL